MSCYENTWMNLKIVSERRELVKAENSVILIYSILKKQN